MCHTVPAQFVEKSILPPLFFPFCQKCVGCNSVSLFLDYLILQNHVPISLQISVQFSSVAQSCPTLCEPMNRSTSGLPTQNQLLDSTQTRVHRVDDAIQPSHPLSSPSSPALSLSQHQSLFQWVHSLYQVAKVLEFQLQHRPSNERSGPITFRMDWLDLLAVQGTLKSLLQHCSSKASILWSSALFIVQPSHPYMTTGKT